MRKQVRLVTEHIAYCWDGMRSYVLNRSLVPAMSVGVWLEVDIDGEDQIIAARELDKIE